MKRLLLLICFSAFIGLAGNPHNSNTIYIEESPVYRPYEALCRAVAMVESSNNPMAYNPKEKATGLYQVRPIRLKDYNQETGKSYKLKDMFDPLKAKEVFMYYALKHHYTETEVISREWNSGPKWKKKNKSKGYYLKVQKILLSL